MKDYEINDSTLCIVPINERKSCVYERDGKYTVNMSCTKIIERSCLYFGSTYDGRRDASYTLLNARHKLPIIIEESNQLIFFPTAASDNPNCIWISYNNFEGIERIDSHFSRLYFKENNQFKVEVSSFIISNQIIRCQMLKNEFIKRKKAV